ncbi:YhgE/Pip domain-containing protein [Lacticaseibacillus mingshuiensis]|uniref:YhgE/Pip domain-containing protein n=1 Tax=Lacticaseibacillus mingshuiensis TaxID=2799574 RepID=UPI001943A406|nr:YhgE/Pip domain-containing protein [Lacticaseibacillus mingshuiensis]
MLKAEWQHLLKNKFMLIVCFAIALIPAIYGVTFLSSMWDPYGKLDELPVAIVNEDQAATMNGATLSVGKDLSANLRKSKPLDFKQATAKEAAAGLKSGKYYAVYTIPTDFSKNATTLLSKTPKTMTLKLATSSGHSFIAGKMASSAATTMQKTLNGQIAAQYAKTLVAAVTQLEGGLKQASTGSKTLASGSTTAASGSKQLASALKKLANGTLTLDQGSQTLKTGIGAYVQAVATAESGSEKISAGLTTTSAELPALTSGMTKLTTGAATISSGLAQLQPALAKLQGGAADLNSNIQTLKTSTTSIAQNSQALATNLATFSTVLQSATAKSNAAQTQLAGLSKLTAAVQTALKGLDSDTASTAVSEALAKEASSLDLTAAQTQAMQDAASQTVSAAQAQQLKALSPLLTQLQTALTQLGAATATDTTTTQTALAQLTTGATRLAQANQAVAQGTTKLAAGSQQLSAGLAKTVTANAQLETGAEQLSSGLQAATPKIESMTSGVSQLASGATQLTSGLETLTSQGQRLNSGATTLTTGLTTASAGSQTAASSTATLATGSQKLATGATTLSAKLATATRTLPTLHYSHNQSTAFASPVSLKQTEEDTVANNGTGMAPYMLGVSLFVCALAMNLMFDTDTPYAKPKHGVAWWGSKVVFLDGVAVLAATILLASMVGFVGLAPVHLFQTWLVLALTAVTFMSLVTWLNLALGKSGSFLAMIILVLQLGGSAGTYPIQLSGGFFEAIHPFLPLTYVVDALRHTLMIGTFPGTDLLVLFCIFTGFSLLGLIHYVRKAHRFTDIEWPAEPAPAK